MDATPVTAWARWQPPTKPKNGNPGKPGYWDYNHIENGHSQADKPADPFGRGWSQATWRKAHGWLHRRPGQPALLEYDHRELFG